MLALLPCIGDRDREVIIIIESADDRIYRLPWHCWSAISDCPQAEITFSLNTYQRQTSTSSRTQPRILAVFDDRTGIDTAADATFIEQLQADVVTIAKGGICCFSPDMGVKITSGRSTSIPPNQ